MECLFNDGMEFLEFIDSLIKPIKGDKHITNRFDRLLKLDEAHLDYLDEVL